MADSTPYGSKLAMLAKALLAFSVFVLVACTAPHADTTRAPTLVFPTRFAEGSNPTALPASEDPAAASDPGDAAAGSGAKRPGAGDASAPPRTGTLPDPPPLRASEHYVYLVMHDHGQVSVQSVQRWRSRTPLPTARSMGRYAIELWIGRELVDRVRFDFPLLAAEPAPRPGARRPLHEPPSLSAGAVVTRRVVVPASQRATRAVLVDRATGSVQPLPWPPPVQTTNSRSAPP
ncbi:MAG: hypothetical protein JW940_23270 [Polyangiaceae bacterium]|nr:hypothetical protein [Polyangiaceae bacterium]